MKKKLLKMIITLCLEGAIIVGIIAYLAYIKGMTIASPFIQRIFEWI